VKLTTWPRAAYFGRVIPKNKIYEHAGANTALKDLFVQQVEQIVWDYKLAPETINIPADTKTSEIQVFRINLKSSHLDHKVLQAIDKAIPFPILFELSYRDQTKLAAAYKRRSESDSTRWVIGRYFESDWQPDDAEREPLPVVRNLSALYERLLSRLVDASNTVDDQPRSVDRIQEAPPTYRVSRQDGPETDNLSLEQRIALAESIEAKQKEIAKIKSRLNREKQFNKRVAINAELREARQSLERLQQQQAATGSH
jgi:hypothetical protein|tara:strand:+ start:5763 stop:6530 length:768 start_codon:yes stop_codon:yes gene_type:complete